MNTSKMCNNSFESRTYILYGGAEKKKDNSAPVDVSGSVSLWIP